MRTVTGLDTVRHRGVPRARCSRWWSAWRCPGSPPAAVPPPCGCVRWPRRRRAAPRRLPPGTAGSSAPCVERCHADDVLDSDVRLVHERIEGEFCLDRVANILWSGPSAGVLSVMLRRIATSASPSCDLAAVKAMAPVVVLARAMRSRPFSSCMHPFTATLGGARSGRLLLVPSQY